MKRIDRINKLLSYNLKEFNVEIKDNSNLHKGHHDFTGSDETHLELILKIQRNKKINRLEIHKLINNLLKKEYEMGLHSLEIKINQF